MKCEMLTDDLLLDYADNKLRSLEAQEIKHHLAPCRPCKHRLHEVSTISMAIQKSPDFKFARPITPEMDLAVLSEIKTLSGRIRRKSNTIPWRMALPYAAAAMVAILAGVLLQHFQTHSMRQGNVVTHHPLPMTEDRPVMAKETEPQNEERSPRVGIKRIPGDVNGDGVVNIADAMLLSRALLDETPLNIELASGDANGDQRVDIGDVQAISMLTVAMTPKEQ